MLSKAAVVFTLVLMFVGLVVPIGGIVYLAVTEGDPRWLLLFILDIWVVRTVWSGLKKISSNYTETANSETVAVSEKIVPVLKRGG